MVWLLAIEERPCVTNCPTIPFVFRASSTWHMGSSRAWLVIAGEKSALIFAAAHFRELFEINMAIDADVH
jgi:hypothetical protein